MNKVLMIATALTAVVVTAPATAATLFDQTDFIAAPSTPTTLFFTAGSTSTAFSFAGYNKPSSTDLANVGLFLNGSGSNLLTTSFSFAPAAGAGCSSASQVGIGFTFLGTCIGDYDTFTQNVATSAGASYSLTFALTSSFAPNGLRITATDIGTVPGTGAVPEPATWAMMLLGFGLAGTALRRRTAKTARLQTA